MHFIFNEVLRYMCTWTFYKIRVVIVLHLLNQISQTCCVLTG